MKNLLLICFLLCTTTVFSQQQLRPSGSGKIESLKIAYITKKLNLSPDEAKMFWPVYNDYSAEMRQARIALRTKRATELETEEKILGSRKKYSAAFRKGLSAEKVDAFFRSEKEFGKYVQKELSERRQLRQQLNKSSNP